MSQAWAVALTLGTPIICILIITVGIVVREVRRSRAMRRQPPKEWAHDPELKRLREALRGKDAQR